jgi:hypothetical protein
VESIKTLENVLFWAKFGKWASDKLAGVRFVHESDKDTLKRIIKQAQKTVCPNCRGRRLIFNSKCDKCHGTGEKLYDPHIKDVEKVMKC